MKFNENDSNDSGDTEQTCNLRVKYMTLQCDLDLECG